MSKPSTKTPRRDGWTPARRDALVTALTQGVGIVRASAMAGPSVSSLYRLLARDPDFAARIQAVFAARDVAPVAPIRVPGFSTLTTTALMRRLTPAARDRAARLESGKIRDFG